MAEKLIPYGRWSQRPRGATRQSHPIGATKGITAHWEGPHMGDFPHSECAEKVRGIQRFHRGTRGWADIAYNALVCPHGWIFEGRGPGVRSAANGGAQVNDDYYAVCYLGGIGDPFTDAAKTGFRAAFGWLTREGGAGPERNGHKDVRPEPTACPGEEIYRWVHALRDNEEDDMAYLDWPKRDREALAEDIAKAVLRTKDVNNRDADGELQKVVSLAAQVSNTESSVDQLRGEVRELTELINRHFNKE